MGNYFFNTCSMYHCLSQHRSHGPIFEICSLLVLVISCSKNKNGSYPETYRCPRKVSTVLCVHKPLCHPADCHGKGDCVLGLCKCRGNWIGSTCSELQCGVLNCSKHGLCTAGKTISVCVQMNLYINISPYFIMYCTRKVE